MSGMYIDISTCKNRYTYQICSRFDVFVLLGIQDFFTPNAPLEGFVFSRAFFANNPKELPTTEAVLVQDNGGQDR